MAMGMGKELFITFMGCLMYRLWNFCNEVLFIRNFNVTKEVSFFESQVEEFVSLYHNSKAAATLFQW